jgi:hypothetical protein
MPRSNVTVRSDLSKLKGLSGKVEKSVGQEVRNIALDLLGEAVNEAPVKEGTLRGSGTAHFGGHRVATGKDFDPQAEGDEGVKGGAGTDETSAVVAFNTVYAEAQHERTDFAHPKGGKAKYLEDPLERNRKQYERKIAEAAKKELS